MLLSFVRFGLDSEHRTIIDLTAVKNIYNEKNFSNNYYYCIYSNN